MGELKKLQMGELKKECEYLSVAYRTKLEAFFDELVSQFEEFKGTNDGIGIENVNYETRKYLSDFLGAGFDVDQIVRMLSNRDVWRNYDLLKSHEASSALLKRRVLEYLDETLETCRDDNYLRNNIGIFFQRGVGFTTLMDKCFWNGYWDYPTREWLLGNGIDEATINKFAKMYHIQ